MTQEDKQLLYKDLCARLPYEVKLDNGLKSRSIEAPIDAYELFDCDWLNAHHFDFRGLIEKEWNWKLQPICINKN